MFTSYLIEVNFAFERSVDLSFQDCCIKSGILPEIYELNFEPTTGIVVYDLLYRDIDLKDTTNRDSSGGSSVKAARNFARCTSSAGYLYKNKFWLLSDLCGDTKEARNGFIKSEGVFKPAGLPAIGWIANGRFRQLDGSPIAFDKKGRPRKYSQPQGKPLEIFCPLVTVATWQAVATKAGLSMPAYPAVGLSGEALGFWDWIISSGCPIIITEGEKKAAALISHGYAAIGLPGIHTGYRVTQRGERVTKPDGTEYQRATARELHAVLQPLDTELRKITILFDYRAGDYSQSQEFKAGNTLSKLFKSAIAKIGKLPDPDKGVDDFLVAGGDIDPIVAQAIDQEKILKQWKLQKWLKLRCFTPDRTINSKYFDAPAPESGTVTAIHSGLGTGKTRHVQEKVASDECGLQINLGYRNSLLLQQCEKWGSYHWDEHKGYLFTQDPDGRLSLCVDSLLKLPIEMFEYSVQHVRGMTIILDESVSVVKQALTAKTLLGKRLEILERLETICQLADRIVLLDGNQSDIVVDYIAKISGKPSVKIQNVFTGDTPPIFFVDAGRNSKNWLSAEILKSPCPAVASDSLRDAEALDLRLRESHGPGILLTSKTVTEDWGKEFLKDPDAYIRKYKPNWLIFSPTAESGIDISIRDYFSDVFCWFVGVIAVDEAVQISRRVPHPERIIVLCPERGLGSRSSGGIFEAEVIKALADLGDTEARLLVEDEPQLHKIREDLATQIITPQTILWAKLQVKAQLERANLREYLLKAFQLGGYSVQQVLAAECSDEVHAMVKQECKDIEAQEIFNAPDIDLSEPLEIKRNYSAAWPERCQSIKALLKAQLPGIEDSELWNWEFVRRVRFDERSLLSQLDAAWQFDNPEDAEYLQRSRLLAGKREFLGDFSNRYLKIRALQALGLEKFLDSSKVWSGDDFEVTQIYERCKKKAITKLLGHPGKMKPMQWLNQLLSLIGYKLIGRRTKRNGVLHREYSFIDELSTPKIWDELIAFTAKKQAKKIAELKEAELLAVQALEAVPPSPVFDTNLGVGGTIPDIKVETPIAETPIANRTGWVSRWGKWVAAKVIGWCEEGARYRILYETKCGEWSEALAFPSQMRWGQTF
jgi:hypothetical protein